MTNAEAALSSRSSQDVERKGSSQNQRKKLRWMGSGDEWQGVLGCWHTAQPWWSRPVWSLLCPPWFWTVAQSDGTSLYKLPYWQGQRCFTNELRLWINRDSLDGPGLSRQDLHCGWPCLYWRPKWWHRLGPSERDPGTSSGSCRWSSIRPEKQERQPLSQANIE